jgi:hypothetical protein
VTPPTPYEHLAQLAASESDALWPVALRLGLANATDPIGDMLAFSLEKRTGELSDDALLKLEAAVSREKIRRTRRHKTASDEPLLFGAK